MPDIKRTQYAKRGVDFSILFGAKFFKVDVSGHQAALKQPSVSTGGGVQALQHIVLDPKLAGGTQHTVGTVNCVTKEAKLRTYECVRGVHQKRTRGRPFPIQPAAYQEFFDKAHQFLSMQKMQITIETKPPGGAPFRRAEPRDDESESSGPWLWLALATILVLALLGYVFLRERFGLG